MPIAKTLKAAGLLIAAVLAVASTPSAGGSPASAEQAEANRAARVLVLYSYDTIFPSTPEYQIELRAGFGAGYDVREEFLDSKRHEPEAMFDLAVESLSYKLSDWGRPDIVIAFDDNATTFADRYDETLLGGAPLVFAGVNSRRRALTVGVKPNATGVLEAVSIEDTIRLAILLSPTPVKRVIGLIDASPTSVGLQESFRPLAERFSGVAFETLSLADYSYPEFLEQLSKERRPDTVFLELTAHRDKFGVSHQRESPIADYASVAGRPVYSLFDHYVVAGAAGGVVLSHRLQARAAVGMAKRILAGEPPAQIPVQLESPNKPLLNARQMERFGLRAGAAPPTALVINARPGVFQRNRDALIGGGGALIAMLGVLLLVTAVNRRAKRRLESINKTLAARNGELREAKARIEHNALHDALTALPNRRYLDMILAEKTQAPDACFAVMQVDLDGFKQINDTLGHAAGDTVLREVARRLRSNIRGRDFVARIGGDEFIIVCEGLTEAHELQGLANRIIAGMGRPVEVEGRSCRFGASVGIASVVEPGVAPKSLLIDVDFALYRAKSLGRNRAEFYSAEMQRHIVQKRELAEDIRRGLEAGEFKCHFQPQVDCRTLEVVGVEALARWEHPERGVLPPSEFLETAESLNLVAELDGVMFQQALEVFHGWRALGVSVPKLSVNVSPKRLAQPCLPSQLSGLGLPRGALSFELLESTFLDRDDPEIQGNIDRIREAGVAIEVDDFGSGHASIVSLIRLQPDRLKIDRFLTAQLTESRQGVTVMRSLLEIAESLKIGVIAEGVETLEQLKLLREMGCFAAQGYLVAKPMDEAAFSQWLYRLPQQAAELNRMLERSAATSADIAAVG